MLILLAKTIKMFGGRPSFEEGKVSAVRKLSLIILSGILVFQISCLKNSPYKKTSNGIVLDIASHRVKVEVCDDNILRVCATPSKSFSSRKSLVVKPDWRKTEWIFKDDKDSLLIETSRLKASINKESGAVSFFQNGKLVLREDPRQPRGFERTNVSGEETWHISQRFQLDEEEAVYGLGQHQDGIMNYRNHDLTLIQRNTHVAVPFLVSTNNYGILWDNYSHTEFHDGSDGMSFWSEVADGVDYYLIAGKDMGEVIKGYRKATGQAPMFGKWAYGYWQSKERYKTGSELLSIAKEYREKKIPVDNIVQDWQYWGKYGWSSMVFDEENFPNAAEMIKTLHDTYHVHLMVSIWPHLGEGSEIYKELEKKNLLLQGKWWTGGRIYDAYSEEARDIYWKYMRKGLFDLGVDAWWMDATEPESYWCEDLFEAKASILKNGPNSLGSASRYLNPYPLVTTEGVYKRQREASSEKRVFILTRSAFAGQQRNAAATWSGDIAATWDVFRNQISAGLNFSLSGIPYWTTDIGAFFTNSRGANYPEGSKSDAYRELYVRWFQFGAFCSIFRSHGTQTPREVWQFGEQGSWAYEALVKFLRLRYRLFPYIYSLAWKTTNEGYAPMRALAMDFSLDKNVSNINNQFMFGPAILVAPVTKPMLFEQPMHPVPSKFLFTKDGEPGGLSGEYYEGADFGRLVGTRKDKNIVFDYSWGAPPFEIKTPEYSVRWTGKIQTQEKGLYKFYLSSSGGVRFWLENKLLIDRPEPGKHSKEEGSAELEANKKYEVKLEYIKSDKDAGILFEWLPPSPKTDTGQNIKIYLPQSCGWYNFWTGGKKDGGTWAETEAPIDIIPLFIKAGSIIPLGPEMQYAAEKPADPVEIRVYCGDDGEFTMYEDEGDNYNYERGVYATISFHWDDKSQTLTIGEREGSFPGMLDERTFEIVWVRENQGIGSQRTEKPDRIVEYSGKKLAIEK